ncbi:MAG: TlpA family protein disulfide reductase [Chloroflexi bacterium]|nr:TlpA family protein disulfide reductase [Chloroflexota bacterium]
MALVGIILAVACGSSGQSARDFEVVQFNGDTFRLSEEVKNQAVVVNFWYPSCPPCREEMPAFEAAWQELKDEPVRILGLYVPQGIDSEEDARNFIEELGLTFNFATDRLARIAEAYELEYFPTTFFIGRDGNVVATHISILKTEEIVRQVRALLGDSASYRGPEGVGLNLYLKTS